MNLNGAHLFMYYNGSLSVIYVCIITDQARGFYLCIVMGQDKGLYSCIRMGHYGRLYKCIFMGQDLRSLCMHYNGVG
jgi:hypothetical protein